MTARRHLAGLLVLAAAGLLACPATGPGPGESRPNLVLVIGDDHGWPYFGFMDHPVVRTPNLDRLAAEGALFPYAFTTASTCRPSLRSLLTGLHPHQWEAHVESRRAAGTPGGAVRDIAAFPTLPRLLAEHGYASFQGGKYWEGPYRAGGFTHGTKSERAGYGEVQAQAGGEGLALGRTTMEPLWEFLDAHREDPFFVWFAPKLPHTPHDAADAYQQPYRDRGLAAGAVGYYANVTRFDARVGELLAYLERSGLRERTVVVYLSDNGWEQDPGREPVVPALGGPRGKASMYELGFRTPLLVRWPGRIAAGAVHERLVSAVDLYPTLLELAGVRPPEDVPGRSLAPLLLGRGDVAPRERVVGGSHGELRPPAPVERRLRGAGGPVREEEAWFLRTPEWRYIWYPSFDHFGDRRESELYRIADDPRETRNLAGEHPQRVTRLRRRLVRWLDETSRPPD